MDFRYRGIDLELITHLIVLTSIFFIFSSLFHIDWVIGDGQHYFAVTRSIIVDNDLNFTNEYKRLGRRGLGAMIPVTQTTVTGLPRSPYPLGMSLIWIPFFITAHLVEQSIGSAASGYQQSYFTAVTTATLIFSYLNLLLIYFFLRRYIRPSIAFVSTITTFICTSIFYYTYHDPSMTHAYSAFFVSAFISYHLRPGRSYSIKDSVISGVLIGLMGLVRWQDIFFCVILLFDAIPLIKNGAKTRLNRFVRYNLLAFFVALIVFSPQLIFWKIIFGSFITSPFPKSTLDEWILKFLLVGVFLALTLGLNQVLESFKEKKIKKIIYLVLAMIGSYLFFNSVAFDILSSSRHGLFIWTPITSFSLVGYLWLDKENKGLSRRLITAFAVQVFFLSLTVTWDGGWSYGIRMLTNSNLVFAVGLAQLISNFKKRVPWFLILLAIVPFIMWNLLLMAQIANHHGIINPSIPFTRILEGQYRRAPAMLWDIVINGRP